MKLFPGDYKRRTAMLAISTIALLAFGYVLSASRFSAEGGFTKITPKSAAAFTGSIGINTHLTIPDYQSNAFFSDLSNQLIKPKIQELGVSHIRQYPNEVDSNFSGFVAKYNQISRGGPTTVNFDWQTGIENDISSNPENNCFLPKVIYLISGLPSACGGLVTQTAPSNIASKAVENPNEPDHCASYICGQATVNNWFANSLIHNPDWPDDILATAAAAHTKLTSNPLTQNLEIIAPSFVWLPYHTNETYHGVNLATYLAPVKNNITFGNVHPYCQHQSVASCFASQVQPYVNYYSPKPVMVTETGHSTATYTENQQAKYLLRILFDFFERGIPRTYIYELLDEPNAPTAIERNHGIINEDGRVKPAFTWLKNAMTLLKDTGSPTLAPLELNISGPNALRTSLLMKSDKSYWLALQNDRSNTTDTDATISVSLGFPTTKNIEYFNLESTTPYLSQSKVTSSIVNIPDRIILARITSPTAAASGGGNSSNGSGSTSTQNKAAEKSTTPDTSANSPTSPDQPSSGFNLSQLRTTTLAGIPVGIIIGSVFGIILIFSLVFVLLRYRA